LTTSGFTVGVESAARFNMPANIAVDSASTSLHVTDASNNAVRKIDIASATVTTVAGDTTAGNKDGIGENARFDTPWGIVTDGTNAYVADAANRIIRKFKLASSTVSVQCGRRLFEYEDGTCAKALFNAPAGLSLDATSSTLYVCDSINNQIRAVRLK
jgi:DNA-binding beta-propeller fold protein YncE